MKTIKHNVNNETGKTAADRMKEIIIQKMEATDNLWRLEQIARFIDNINRAD